MSISAKLVLTGILAFLAFALVMAAQDPGNIALRTMVKGLALMGVGAIVLLAAFRVGLPYQFRLIMAGGGALLVFVGAGAL